MFFSSSSSSSSFKQMISLPPHVRIKTLFSFISLFICFFPGSNFLSLDKSFFRAFWSFFPRHFHSFWNPKTLKP
jgi:hypothetical protein